jgi:hypothetical protein
MSGRRSDTNVTWFGVLTQSPVTVVQESVELNYNNHSAECNVKIWPSWLVRISFGFRFDDEN